MTVRFNALSISGGGVRAVTRFTDNFDRALLGQDWIVEYGLTTFLGVDQQDTTVVIAANALSINHGGAGGNQCNITVIPIKTVSGLLGKTQFSEARYVSSSAIATARTGPCILQQPINMKSSCDGYSLQNNGVANQMLLRRTNVPASTILSNPFVNPFAFGDILRLSAEWNGALTEVTIRVSINGTLHNTFVDAAPTIATGFGFPAIWILGLNPGQTDVWDDFTCGLGL